MQILDLFVPLFEMWIWELQLDEFRNQSNITCIPKEDNDRRHIKNRRPFSLINTDTKIPASVISNRV